MWLLHTRTSSSMFCLPPTCSARPHKRGAAAFQGQQLPANQRSCCLLGATPPCPLLLPPRRCPSPRTISRRSKSSVMRPAYWMSAIM